MMKNYIKSNFTLVELLVAMAVFSVFLVIVMQFFTGIQNAWHASDKRTKNSSEARVAMDVASNLLTSLYYTCDISHSGTTGVLFKAELDEQDGKIYFACQPSIDLPGTGVRYVSLSREENEKKEGFLVLSVFSNDDDDPQNKIEDDQFAYFFPPFDTISRTERLNDLINKPDSILKKRAAEIKTLKYNSIFGGILLNNVVSFGVKAFNRSGNTVSEVTHTNLNYPNLDYIPYCIEIEFVTLMPEDYRRWIEASGEEREQIVNFSGHKFKRLFYYDNR